MLEQLGEPSLLTGLQSTHAPLVEHQIHLMSLAACNIEEQAGKLLLESRGETSPVLRIEQPALIIGEQFGLAQRRTQAQARVIFAHLVGHFQMTLQRLAHALKLVGGLAGGAVGAPPPAAALLTTAGNPVCTAAGRAVLKTIVSEGLVDNAAKVGVVLADSLRTLADSPGGDRIGDVRGRGLAIGLELVDPASGDRDPRLAAAVVYRAWELGAVVYYVGGNVLEITPPLVLTESQAAQAAEIIGAAIGDAAAGKIDAEEVAKYAGW